MRPDELLAELERRRNAVPNAVTQAEAAAMAVVTQAKVTGHLISGRGKHVRVQGGQSKAVARRIAGQARKAMVGAFRRAMQ